MTAIGSTVHDDVHVVLHAPGDSNMPRAGTDGGVFVSTDPTAASPTFASRNNGLTTQATEYFAQHPASRR